MQKHHLLNLRSAKTLGSAGSAGGVWSRLHLFQLDPWESFSRKHRWSGSLWSTSCKSIPALNKCFSRELCSHPGFLTRIPVVALGTAVAGLRGSSCALREKCRNRTSKMLFSCPKPFMNSEVSCEALGLAETYMQLSEGISGAEGPRQISKGQMGRFQVYIRMNFLQPFQSCPRWQAA